MKLIDLFVIEGIDIEHYFTLDEGGAYIIRTCMANDKIQILHHIDDEIIMEFGIDDLEDFIEDLSAFKGVLDKKIDNENPIKV